MQASGSAKERETKPNEKMVEGERGTRKIMRYNTHGYIISTNTIPTTYHAALSAATAACVDLGLGLGK